MGESLWLDESLSTHTHLKNIIFFASTIGPWERMPFYFAWMFAWGKFFGDSEIILRVPSLLAGLGSVYMLYRVAWLVAGQKTALLAAFFLALSPVHIWYSTEARPYIFGTFFLIAALYAYWNLKEKDRFSGWHLAYTISMLANVFTHPYLFTFAVLFCILSFFGGIRRKIIFLGLNAAILFVFTVYILVRSKIFSPIFGLFYLRPFGLIDGWMLYFNWFPTGNTIELFDPYSFEYWMLLRKPWVLFGQILLMVLIVRGAASILHRGDRTGRERGLEILALLLSLPVFFLFLSAGLGLKHIYLERNASFILPYYWIAVAAGITSLRTRWIRDTVLIFALSLSVLSAILLFARQNEWTVYKPNPDMRAAAAYFGDHLDRKGPNFIVWSVPPVSELTYYDPRLLEQSHFYELRMQIGLYISALKRLERFGFLTASEPFEKVLREDPDIGGSFRWKDIRVRRGRKAPDVKKLRREGVRIIYLLVNQYWVSTSRSILEELRKNKELRFVERKDLKGLEIYKFEINPSVSGGLNQSSG